MEQAGCWLVPNRTPKCISDESSWEERAFAEDIGGCVWPPRSYSCNFCRREFRSAQALGGHMNVHRRDRARLKLLSNTTKSNHLSNNQSNTFAPHNNKDQNPSLFASNNNPESHPFVSSFFINNNTHEKTLSFFCLSNDTNGKNNKDLLPFKITKNNDMMMKASNNNHPFIGLSTGSVAAADDDDDDEAPNNPNKRRKVDTSSSSPLVVTKITKKVEDHTSIKVNVSHEIEELDLELRLGDRPKVP